MWRWLAVALLATLATACGGNDDKNTQADTSPVGAAATRTPPAATPAGSDARPSVEEQLAIIDGTRTPEPYQQVLQSLGRKCRESTVALADAIVTERVRLQAERNISITVLDYLRGINSVIPEDRTGVDCHAVAVDLGQNIGR